MNTIDVEIEPPGLETIADDDSGDPYTAVHVTIFEVDGTRRAGSGGVAGEGTDDQVAGLLVDALVAVAAHRGPGLTAAVHRRLAKVVST